MIAENMVKTQLPSNFLKHTSNNPIQKFLINNFYSTLINLVKSLSPDSILDAGCGEGFTLNKLRENKIGKELEGIDYSKDALLIGKKAFPNLSLKYGSVYNLRCKNDSFDLVLCTEVLEHLEYPKKALLEILRISKKYILVTVPNEPLFMLSNFLRGKNILRLGNDPGHINHWTIISFQNFLKNNGVKIKTLKLPFPWIIILGEKQ